MIELLLFWRGYIQHVIIVLLFLYALARGAPPERYASAIMLGMLLLDYLHLWLLPQGALYWSIDPGLAAIDVLALFAFSVLAMRSNRIYPLCMLGAQLMSTLMHLNRHILPDMDGLAFLLLTRVPSYIQLMALGLGLIAHRRRIRRYGIYRSWRQS